jgi:hypothetical protein
MTKKAWVVLFVSVAAFALTAYLTAFRTSPPISRYQRWPLSYAKCFKLYEIPYLLSAARESLLVSSDYEIAVFSGCT